MFRQGVYECFSVLGKGGFKVEVVWFFVILRVSVRCFRFLKFGSFFKDFFRFLCGVWDFSSCQIASVFGAFGFVSVCLERRFRSFLFFGFFVVSLGLFGSLRLFLMS